MTDRMDIVVPRKRGDKTYWQRIGSAWPRDGGEWRLEFDALPVADAEGRTQAFLFHPKAKGEKAQPAGGDPGDAIPF